MGTRANNAAPIPCPNCLGAGLSAFYEQASVPAHSVLLMGSREEAIHYPRGDIQLGFCGRCGFITNLAYDPSLQEFSTRYEETQGFSPTFSAFSQGLAKRLVERYDLRQKRVLEIGCGKGEFLTLLCELGENSGVGFDPSYVPGRLPAPKRGEVEFIQDYYSSDYAHYSADFLCCKMTLEHIPNPHEFIDMVRRSLEATPQTVVFFMVPDATRILGEGAFWDIYYEHCSYFTPGSLAHLFRDSGFEVIDLERAYGDQYITITAKAAQGNDQAFPELEASPEATAQLIEAFKQKVGEKLDAWEQFLQKAQKRDERTVIWGAGSKGVAFLTALKGGEQIEYCVDINPHKHSSYMPGSGQQIVSPAALGDYHPDNVIVMNPIYREEVQDELEQMGLQSRVMMVNEPEMEGEAP